MIIQPKLPKQNELVLITIVKVMPHGAYCHLQEYGIDAYMPVREVAPGWIKNIHEFIKEGGKDVAKVIFVDAEKRSVDVSLKKTRAKEKKDKINDFNLEKRAQGFFDQAITTAELQSAKEAIKTELVKKFATYSDIVNAITEREDAFEGVQVDKKFEEALVEIVKKSIKPKVFSVSYIAKVNVYDTLNGIALLRKMFGEVEGADVAVTYMGAPHYMLVAKGSNYPEAEDKIKKAEAVLEKYQEK